MPPTNNGSTEDVPPPVIPVVHHESISEPAMLQFLSNKFLVSLCDLVVAIPNLLLMFPFVSTVSPTLTPFGDSDFLLFEEADSFLAIEDDPTSPEVDSQHIMTLMGTFFSLEAILNSDPSPPPPNLGNYFPGGNSNDLIKFVGKQNSSVTAPP
ncbi:hypothetical protein Tco_1362000 [Tanacetum coccineum]